MSPGITVEDGIIIERDVPVTLRDGTIIYTDIYRPDGISKVPAIVAWSPYGKHEGHVERVIRSIPGLTKPSPMAKREGPDPAYWCKHGYAVANPDVRGAGNSQGDIRFWGTADGRDGYDFVEWLASRDWCNGKIAFSGNSWLAISQWFIAAEQPPHLAAIAPWEGHSDMYRDDLCAGGIIENGFNERSIKGMVGPNYVEDTASMICKYPFMNSYWEDKIPCFEKIEVPAYVVASWTNPIHTSGTFRAFRKIASRESGCVFTTRKSGLITILPKM